MYQALQPLWHSKELRDVPAGEVVDLFHLNEQQIQQLIDNGAVCRVEKQENTNGINNRGGSSKRTKA
ncbi:MAG TPA: hypothetical protein PL074_00260 [Thermoflexales bacterium]|nr:hypothetical protein [Thermoflexales bacterium]HQX74709.1 hypothetical protein [Thermoflexales bacterium]